MLLGKLTRLLVPFVVLGTTGLVRADLDADREQLSELEMRCATALVDGDVEWLDSFYDLKWFLIGSDGRRFTRRQTLAQLGSGELKWRSCVVGAMEVRVFGDVAIVIYKATALGEVHGAKIEETELCTDTFVRVDGGWRCVHSHNRMLR